MVHIEQIGIANLALALGLLLTACALQPVDAGVGDDDTTWDGGESDPDCEGFTDLAGVHMEASCTVTEAVTPFNPDSSGYFEFLILFDGWAAQCWIELWDLTSGYCEGYYPETGLPCMYEGISRPGWVMNATDFDGMWGTDDCRNEWSLTLDYHHEEDLWSPDDDASWFICEDAGSTIQLFFCCCDDHTYSVCDCVEFPMDAW